MSKLKSAASKQTYASIAHLTEQLYSDLRQSSLKHWLGEHKVAQRLDERVQEWAYQAKNNLDTQHPYQLAAEQLEKWLALDQVSAEQFQQMLEQYQAFTQQMGLPELSDFWQYQLQQGSASSALLQFQLLKEKWQRKLTEAVTHWEFEQLAQMRDAFLEEIKDFLASLQKMSRHNETLGADTGIFIDYSSGKLTAQDVQSFEEWSLYLDGDAELKRLCRLLGSAQPSRYPRKALAAKIHTPPEQLIRQQASEEIAGIQLGQDLGWALPNELAQLADPDLQILFDLKYLESNIMSFHLQGQQAGKVLDDPKHPKKQLGQKGPMIVCLDTSGSMHGQPELISKAMCLYLGVQAMREKRPMYLINFSTHLTALSLQTRQGLDDLIHFLSQSFHGGTDIIPAMEHAIGMLESPEFQNADIAVISDFIMGQLSIELMEQVECFRQRGTGFYAVAIGSFRLDHLDKGLFDHQWVYQSSSGKVIELQSS
ncbi:VWA domain-containing protein [Acinetobacter tianfuensis]|uniref:VWA domain-containing protein n=1 Tax=Acinetobacter tianfuensis TaxID=2419603 RepID=A0A3A8EH35_9GAMM|nr:VWA domain-containing protein [Acinetobacter tianfuensis]RKG29314.1 VWA domain-containing protein [Acinetobacter tianfuensis]